MIRSRKTIINGNNKMKEVERIYRTLKSVTHLRHDGSRIDCNRNKESNNEVEIIKYLIVHMEFALKRLCWRR